MTETTHAQMQSPSPQPNSKGSGLAITSLVLGLVALLLAFIPIINNFAFVLAIIGLVFGGIAWRGARKGKRTGKGMAIAGVILAVVSGAGVLISQQIYSDVANDIGNELNDAADDMQEEADRATGDATDDILANDLDLKLGEFKAIDDGYGYYETSLTATLTNKSNLRQSFSLTVEAVDADGNRIIDDIGNADDLAAGQSTKVKLFIAVDQDKIEKLSKATFQVVEATAF